VKSEVDVVLTAHARRRFDERGVTEAQVRAALARPDWIEADPSDETVTRSFKAGLAGDSRVLRVVWRAENDRMVVITAFFDRGARRSGRVT